MIKKIMILCCFTAISFGCMLGCNITNGDSDIGNGFSSDMGLPAHEYTVYLSEELTTVMNQLTSRMSNGKSVFNAGVDVASEITATEYSIKVCEGCLNEIKLLNYGINYEDDYKEAVRLVENAINELKVYKGLLSERVEQETIMQSVKRMETIFISLTAVMNQVYQ